ncbi:tyrosine-protein phosphatase [Pseudomonas typographi]|uniref:Dual specificity protein phosphatase family protein n=1 Tax=Pseudomonas typographi TaxID=2715964 RepID=A0ABR7Z667_9PSED|nr:tyrosine-protein phosphatase [Pseudomonas typographi]MBD1553527.1 dual specificity protein phosphatase family protein [Pseudomonas typographi]MBD1601001.1 dual specificity protein phosphatase family protein [Pseudomonas typographi]
MQAISHTHRRRVPLAAARLLAALAVVGLASLHHDARAPTPLAAGPAPGQPQWARSLDPRFNLFQMSPTLYRSALPTLQNASTLQGLGVRTVVSFIKDDDHAWSKDPSIRLLSQPLHADRVTDDEVLQALRTVRAAQAQGPVLIHCKHGNNRTGIVAAMYRIVVEGWPREAALAEMQNGGFGSEDDMAEAANYVRHADVQAISQALDRGEACAHAWSMCGVKGWLSRR